MNSIASLFACLLLLLAIAVPGRAVADIAPGERTLYRELAELESLVLEDPWQAHQRLSVMAPRAGQAGALVRTRYNLRLAQSLLYLYRGEEFSRAIEAGLEAAGEGSPADERLMLEILHGIRLRRGADYDASLRVLESVQSRADSAGLPFLVAFALAEAGFSRSLSGRHEVALLDLQEAHALASAQQDPFLMALVEETLGAAYGYIEEYSQSIEHYKKALAIYRELGYRGYQAEAIYGLGISYRYWERWNRAIDAFSRYRAMVTAAGSEHVTFMADYGLGMTHAERGDCEQALPAIERALAGNAPRDFEAELYKRQAVCLAHAGQAELAHSALAAARDIFAGMHELDGTHWEIGLLDAEARTAAAVGKHAVAYQRLRDYHDAMLELHRANTSERLMSLRVEMENTRKDTEIALLREQTRADALKLEQQRRENDIQRMTTFSWIAASCVAAVFLGVQLRNTRRFRDLSTRDDLTGLYNRRFIFDRLASLVDNTQPLKGQLAILLMDVDNFKVINDRHGHPAGDAVLASVATRARELLRPGDEIARVGGEEFLCLLPRASVEQASQVARRLLDAIRNHRFELDDGTSLKVTLSIGVASLDNSERDPEVLYAAADDALYRAKQAGKDRYELAVA